MVHRVPNRTPMTPAVIRRFYGALRAANAEPRTELVYATPWQLLVAVILSAQATDRSVNAATAELFKVAPDPAALTKLGLARLKQHIRTIGLYNSKARHIIAATRMLLDLHGGQVPAERAALEALPGVGRKTANVVLNAVFGQGDGIALGQAILQGDRALDGVDHAPEFGQQAVAHQLEDAAVVGGDFRFEQLLTVGP